MSIRTVLVVGFVLHMVSMCSAQWRVMPTNVSKQVTVLECGDHGFLLYGTSTGEFGLYDGAIFNKQGKLSGRINRIYRRGESTLYMTSKGLYEYDNGELTQLSANTLNVLDVSPDSKLMITTTGVYIKSGSDYVPFGEEFYDVNDVSIGQFLDLEGNDGIRMDRIIYTEDKKWSEDILHRADDCAVVPYDDRILISDQRAIVSYDHMAGTIDTLVQVDSVGRSKMYDVGKGELLYCADGQIALFDVRDRALRFLHGIDTELITSATRDDWGNIWVAAGSFLYKLVDTGDPKSGDAPEVFIQNVKINGVSLPEREEIRLDQDANDLQIKWVGVHLTFPQDVEYQSRLVPRGQTHYENLSTNLGKWTPLTKTSEVEYRNLAAGHYKFELRSTVDGENYTYSSPIKIRVIDDTFQKIWLMALLGLLGILLTAIFFNTRYNRLKEASARERKLLQQENKMLTLQQKALQLQMNPHFVFNALNSIQGLIAKEDNRGARRYLQQFSSMMRSVLNQSRQELISLGDEVAYLLDYLSLEQMANNDKFEFSISCQEEDEMLKIPTMIIQPFVENAVLHGIRNLKGRVGQIQVSFQADDHHVTCVVEDNGVGRVAAGKVKRSTHESVATKVVEERLGGKMAGKVVKYTDLVDSDDSPVGTSVEIRMPIGR